MGKVLRLRVPMDRVLAFDGPDEVTGLVDIYVLGDEVGRLGQVVVKEVEVSGEVEADEVRGRFRERERSESTGELRLDFKGRVLVE